MKIIKQSQQSDYIQVGATTRTAAQDQQYLYQEIMDSWLPYGYILEVVLTCRSKIDPSRWVWQDVASDRKGAEDYYYNVLTDPEEKRSEAASVASANGWTVRDIGMRKA